MSVPQSGAGEVLSGLSDGSRKQVENTFHFLYLMLLWVAVVAVAHEIHSITSPDVLMNSYCKKSSTSNARVPPPPKAQEDIKNAQSDAPPSSEGKLDKEGNRIDQLSSVSATRCTDFSQYATLAKAKSIQFDLKSTNWFPLVITLFVFLFAIRSFLGLHFAANDAGWNAAQQTWCAKKAWSFDALESREMILSGVHLALLGILAISVKVQYVWLLPATLVTQSILTWYYNWLNWGAFRSVLFDTPGPQTRWRYTTILFLDSATTVFAFSLLAAVFGYSEWLNVAFFCTVACAGLFVMEIVNAHSQQLFAATAETWRVLRLCGELTKRKEG